LLILLLAGTTLANDAIKSAVSTLTSPGAELSRRLDAVDKLAAVNATGELIRAWASGGEAVRLAVPVGFHAMGVRALGQGLTAMGAEDERDRAAGAVLLGSIGRAARLGVRKLLIALTDDSELVRRHAAEALGNIGAAAEESVSGLIALAQRDPKLAPIAMRAVARITLDVQLHLYRKPLPPQVKQLLGKAESWLLTKQKKDGSWGSYDETAMVVLALAEGGLRDEFRKPVRQAMRHLVLKLGQRPRAEPLVLLAAHATWRETRDPLLRILADRVGARVQAMKVELPAKQGWRLLAMRNAQWSGNALDPQLLLAKEPPEPDLLGIALAPKYDRKTAEAAAERMVTDKLVWTSHEQRWSPGQIVRGSWAIQLTGGKPADDYRKLVYKAAIPNRLVVNDQMVKWEPAAGVEADAVQMTAGVIIAMKLVSGRYPARVLPTPKAASQRMALAALQNCRRFPNEELQKYAVSILTLWE
jgi:hypothetical protein